MRRNGEKARQIRLEKQKHDRGQREVQLRKEREAYLKNLVQRKALIQRLVKAGIWKDQ